MKIYDVIIIGAGIYGLSGALNESLSKKKILIIEKEKEILTRASYVNQARVHNGYHYPRSVLTATNSARYFEKFYKDYKFAINKEFKSIYAISKEKSYITKEEFEAFCQKINIPCEKVDSNLYFKNNTISCAYETKEYVYDIELIRRKYKELISKRNNIEIQYTTYIEQVDIKDNNYILKLNTGETVCTNCVLNTTYASINAMNEMFGFLKYEIKYELCEVELGAANKPLKDIAVTIMDGPFFSVMPFGKSGFHSLTSVNHTPHDTCYKKLPEFECQASNPECSSLSLRNCNECKYKAKPKNNEMMKLFKIYMKEEYKFEYKKSLFAIKPILSTSEKDDSRPTIIKKHRENPSFISCFSGKFNTIYILDEFLKENFK